MAEAMGVPVRSRSISWSWGRALLLMLVVGGMCSVFAAVAHAQVLYGSLTGVVTDSSGAAIAGATVQAREVSKGITQQATTDSAGLYRFSEMLPGNWDITVSAPGFGLLETKNIRVDANVVARVDEKMSIANVKQVVIVTTAPPLLQTDRSDIHTELSEAELQALPTVSSEGKNFQDLLRIVPGSTIPLENNSAAGNPARAMTSNVNGQSTQGNDTRIDGILDAYPWLPNNVAYVPPEDAIETVNITTNSMDAEQGMANGAEVNVITKSGTNHFHGDAYEFHTDDDLKAINYFEPPGYKRPLNIFNQFGGSVGGPIKRDKLFFFIDYQGTRQTLAPAGGNPQTVPFGSLQYANAMSAGYFDFRPFQNAEYQLTTAATGAPVHIYDPNTGNPDGTGRTPISCNGIVDTICLSRVDPAALAMLKLIPAPTPSLATLPSNNYLDTQKGTFHTDDYDAKVSYVPSEKSTLFGHFSTSRGDIYDPPSLGPAEGNATNGGQLGNASTKIYVVGLGGTHTFTPNLLLDGNLGFTRQHLTAEAPDIAADGPFGLNTLKIPGTNNSVDPNDSLYYGIPAFQFTTFTNLGNPNTGNPFVFRDNQYVANSNLTWVKGTHQFRFGGEWDHVQMNHFQPQGGTFQTARGSFGMNGTSTSYFTCTGGPPLTKESCGTPAAELAQNLQWASFADFLLGLPYEDGKAVQDTDPIALRWSQWAAYARDMWQVTPKLSIDYGVRWEYYPMAYSDHGKGARVLDPSTMQVYIGGYGSVPKNDGVKTGWGQLLPRIGIAYKATPSTVVRLGFGISSDSNNWRYLRNDYPADTISSYSGTNTGGTTNYSSAAPSDSLTGTNATGPYASLPIGIVLIPTPNISSGVIPLPNNITTNTIGDYPNFRRGYIYSYNLTIEQEFAGFVADVSYVGEEEVRPVENLNLNAAPAGGGAAGELLNAKFGGTWGAIQTLIPLGRSYYNALQTKLTRRLSNNSTIGVLYTWSKAQDIEDDEELNSVLWNYPAYFNRNLALAGFDHDYNFEAYWVYNLPFGHGQNWATHGIGAAVLGGWTFSGVLSRLGGAPFTVTDNSAPAVSLLAAPGNQQTPNIVAPIHITKGRPAYSPGLCQRGTNSCSYFDITSFAEVPSNEPATFGDAGRNIIRGPGYFDLDANIFRNFTITHFLTFRFEADAFGLTNTPHFANPDSNITDSNFGKITGEASGNNASLGGSGGERLWYFGGKFIF